MAGDKKIVGLQESLSGETEKFRAIQKDLNKCLGSAQQLEAQLKENEVVKEELGLAKDDSKIYKMIGPVLVKQVNRLGFGPCCYSHLITRRRYLPLLPTSNRILRRPALTSTSVSNILRAKLNETTSC